MKRRRNIMGSSFYEANNTVEHRATGPLSTVDLGQENGLEMGK